MKAWSYSSTMTKLNFWNDSKNWSATTCACSRSNLSSSPTSFHEGTSLATCALLLCQAISSRCDGFIAHRFFFFCLSWKGLGSSRFTWDARCTRTLQGPSEQPSAQYNIEFPSLPILETKPLALVEHCQLFKHVTSGNLIDSVWLVDASPYSYQIDKLIRVVEWYAWRAVGAACSSKLNSSRYRPASYALHIKMIVTFYERRSRQFFQFLFVVVNVHYDEYDGHAKFSL